MNLIPHVPSEKLRALEKQLGSGSVVRADYLILVSASSIIATLGLFLNSAAVIIGAMIIAPLMGPLMGLSLSILTADVKSMIRAAFSLLVGTIVGACLAWMFSNLLISLELTSEIMQRIRPNLMDLGVAFVAGAAGAYCITNERLSNTVAGVAIAVALMPPLCVIGIGLSRADLDVWSGASLLYITNLVGITVSGALTFYLLGYSPLKRAKRGLFISFISTVILTVPLGYGLYKLVLENRLRTEVKSLLQEKTYTFRGVTLRNLEVTAYKRPIEVIVTVYSPEKQITAKQVRLVEEFLHKETGHRVRLTLKMIPEIRITADDDLIIKPRMEKHATPLPAQPPTVAHPEAGTQEPPGLEDKLIDKVENVIPDAEKDISDTAAELENRLDLDSGLKMPLEETTIIKDGIDVIREQQAEEEVLPGKPVSDLVSDDPPQGSPGKDLPPGKPGSAPASDDPPEASSDRESSNP